MNLCLICLKHILGLECQVRYDKVKAGPKASLYFSLTFMLSILERALRGLNPLNVLMTLNTGMSSSPDHEAIVLIKEN